MEKKNRKCFLAIGLWLVLACFLTTNCLAQGTGTSKSSQKWKVVSIVGTSMFPRVEKGRPLKQLVRVSVEGLDTPADVRIRVSMDGKKAYDEPLGSMKKGRVIREVLLPENDKPAKLKVELVAPGGKVLASNTADLMVPRKFTFYFVQYSHQDLGCGDYPFRRRTRIRHGNIVKVLDYCRQTDQWDPDSRFRYLIETSEPVTSFLGMHSDDVVEEFQRRVREGRIQIGAMLSTSNTEQLSHECMARLFYLANRHSCDLLGVKPSRTAVQTDVIGMTWPLVTFCNAAELNLAHGYNGRAGSCMKGADKDPLCYWKGPDGRSRVLLRHKPYGGAPPMSETYFRHLLNRKVMYDDFLIMFGADFTMPKFSIAQSVHDWNKKYAWPRAVNSTLDMFFDAIADKKPHVPLKVFEGGSNNEWASMDSNDARILAMIRLAGEMLPTAEKLSTIASVLTPGGYPWTDIYQAYHRMLLFHEHTNGAECFLTEGVEGTKYYETELEENREMARDTLHFGRRAMDQALNRLCAAISTGNNRTLAVFNPLGRVRTDLARVSADLLPGSFRLVDSVSGSKVEHQAVDGDIIFVAAEVPAMGYKTFRVEQVDARPKAKQAAESLEMENRFYKIRFDGKKGGILSIFDKELEVELVDSSAPNQFNSYLYEKLLTNKIDSNKWYGTEKGVCRYTQGPVARYMDISCTAEGVRSLKQRVILYDGLKRIDFVMEMDKAPSGRTIEHYAKKTQNNKEAVYVALPFAVPDFTIRHELPGAVTEPYRRQLQGSCSSYYSVRHFSDISNDKFGVTVSSIQAPLIEYGYPRSHPMTWLKWGLFGKSLEYPKHSRMYLYLMNNMWNMNMNIDQPGPHGFRWSIRSHAGNWQTGGADRFGWDIHNPLVTGVIKAGQKGHLPEKQQSFAAVKPVNVRCTTVKVAEQNGSGLIIRLVETGGKATEAEVSLPFLAGLESVRETNLVEVDKPGSIAVRDDGISFSVKLLPFDVKTIRVVPKTAGRPAKIARVEAKPVSDMEIALSWPVDKEAMKNISHFNVYRDRKADFKPTLLNLVQRPAVNTCVDRPILHYGGWINNRLYPDTKYYYRIAPVDRWNNQGPLSEAIEARTLKPDQKNMVPLRVEQLSAILISPVAPLNYVNLLFRTSCEPDIAVYEIHRSTSPGYTPSDATRIGEVRSDEVITGTDAHPEPMQSYPVKDFDHAMYPDSKVQPDTTYYYRVCAVDKAGQKGPFSKEASVRTKKE